MAVVTRDIRGIPLWLLRDYLVDLDGTLETDNLVVGPGWRVQLTRLADVQIGSLRVGEVRLEMSGAPEVIAALERSLWPKLLRGGG